MIATKSLPMSSQRAEFVGVARRAARWLLPAALLALTPKCVLCLLAYIGLGTALGLGGPELCGAAVDSTMSWMNAFAWLGIAEVVAAIAFLIIRKPAEVTRPRCCS